MPADIDMRSVDEILTIKLAVVVGALLQVGFTAVEVTVADATLVTSPVPEDCPELADHSTVYGTVPVPLESVKACDAPFPVARIV